MKQENKFILMNREEFFNYIMNLKVKRKITLIQNHHTWSPSYKNCNSTNQIYRMQKMEEYHVSPECGFICIAQHFSTFKDGLICTGRDIERDPAGILGANQGAICFEHIGDFDKGGDTMTEEHKLTIAFANAVLHYKFNLPINTDTSVYHNWFKYISPMNDKTCPGTAFFGGNTKESAKQNLYPLIKNELNKLTKPEPKIEQWEYDCCQKLVDLKFTKDLHKPREMLTTSLIAAMFNNHLYHLDEINDIPQFLIDNGFFKSEHQLNEEIVWEVFAKAMNNKINNGETGIDLNKFLFDRGFITSYKTLSEKMFISQFGACMNNYLTKGNKFIP